PIPGRTPTQAATQIIQDPSNPAKFWVSVTDSCVGDAGDIMTGDGAASWSISSTNFTGLFSRIGLSVTTSGIAYLAAADCTTNGIVDMEKTVNGGSSLTTIPVSGPGTPNVLIDYFVAVVGGRGHYENVITIHPYNTTGNTDI